jgi:hypothetical protein
MYILFCLFFYFSTVYSKTTDDKGPLLLAYAYIYICDAVKYSSAILFKIFTDLQRRVGTINKFSNLSALLRKITLFLRHKCGR